MSGDRPTSSCAAKPGDHSRALRKRQNYTRSGRPAREEGRLVAGVDQLLVDVLHKRPEHIHIVIDAIDEENRGLAGMLTTDYRKQQPG